MKYKIAYKNPTSQYIPIEATFNVDGHKNITLQFPAWRPGRYELGNFARNVQKFRVTDAENKAIPFTKNGKGSWEVGCNNTDLIKVSYYYYAHELNAGSTFMDDLQLYVNPVNCLVYIEERQDSSCELVLDIPSNFEIACGAKHDNNIIKCSSFHELVDSPFIASATLQHKTYTVFGKLFHLWFQGGQPEWDTIIPDFEKFTKTQLEKFSDRRSKTIGFPVDEYHFLFQILPIKAYHGVEHQSSTVIALGPDVKLMSELYDEFLGVSSHELYHTWNIKAIRPVEMFPYDYAKENFSHLGYVAEGVTTYLGDVFLAESGVRDFSWYKKEFEKLLQKHFDNFGRFNYSVADSSWDTWLDGYVPGAPFRKVSIYNEGALLAFVTDIKIRFGSANKASLHDVMNALYTRHAQKDKGYSEADYKALCEEFSGEDFTVLFENYIHGTRPFESILTEALERIGYTLEMTENPKHSERILGVKTRVTEGKAYIQQIFPGSTAELGELMIGDEILALNGIVIKDDLDKVVGQFKDNPLEIKIKRMGRELNKICPNTNRAMYPVYSIKKSKAPSNLNKRIFKKWIGKDWDAV